MILFVRNIPSHTLPDDLAHFAESAVENRLFSLTPGSITKCETLLIVDKHSNAFEYHGLVHIDNDKAAQRAIKLLNGNKLNGAVVSVREYFSRSWHNDMRQRRIAGILPPHDKRKQDRRRNPDQIDMIKTHSATRLNNRLIKNFNQPQFSANGYQVYRSLNQGDCIARQSGIRNQ
jgi:RNA recognition motif-containing protein